ncbi:hypothetical protein NCTGTJJY_CDS0041 [Serratia phage 92A1]|nr:hypothetical protein NCTGTJJY_CDS0041 [Serratia phage 92A1]
MDIFSSEFQAAHRRIDALSKPKTISTGDMLSAAYSDIRDSEEAMLNVFKVYAERQDKLAEIIKEYNLPIRNLQEESLFMHSLREYDPVVRRMGDAVKRLAKDYLDIKVQGEPSTMDELIDRQAKDNEDDLLLLETYFEYEKQCVNSVK